MAICERCEVEITPGEQTTVWVKKEGRLFFGFLCSECDKKAEKAGEFKSEIRSHDA